MAIVSSRVARLAAVSRLPLSVANDFEVVRSQTSTIPSARPDASRLPSDDTSRATTPAAGSSRAGFASLMFQERILPSVLAANRRSVPVTIAEIAPPDPGYSRATASSVLPVSGRGQSLATGSSPPVTIALPSRVQVNALRAGTAPLDAMTWPLSRLTRLSVPSFPWIASFVASGERRIKERFVRRGLVMVLMVFPLDVSVSQATPRASTARSFDPSGERVERIGETSRFRSRRVAGTSSRLQIFNSR